MRTKTEEEWWSSVLKGGCVWVTHTSYTRGQDGVDGNRKLLWKEGSKTNGGKVENSNRIKDGNGRLVLEETEVRRIWKEYYEDLYNIDS